MNNINFIKVPISDKENTNKYFLNTETEELGYAYINPSNSINNVYFFIHPQYRSNGFGTLLFSKIIAELKSTTQFPHITLDVEKTNIFTNNIIAKLGGLILSEDKNTHWIIKL